MGVGRVVQFAQPRSLRGRANARKVSSETLYGGQFTSSNRWITQLFNRMSKSNLGYINFALVRSASDPGGLFGFPLSAHWLFFSCRLLAVVMTMVLVLRKVHRKRSKNQIILDYPPPTQYH